MANIHFIGGEKGGVGKSVVARILAQYMIDRSIPFIGFDTDRSHGALMRFYAGYAAPVSIDSYAGLDAIVEAATERPERRVLVDLAAQTHEPLARWIDESGVTDLGAEMGFSVRYWHVMDSGRDSVDLLKRLLDRFGARISYVLVQNQLRGDAFDILDRSGERERALELGAKVVNIKRVHDAAINKIDAHSTSFWAACNRQDDAASALSLLERQRIKVWLKHACEQIDAAGV